MSELDRAGRSDLHYAALEGNIAAAKELLDQSADVNLADCDGFTPLHYAAQGYHRELARLLLITTPTLGPRRPAAAGLPPVNEQ